AAIIQPRAVARDALAHVAVAEVCSLVRTLGRRARVEVRVLPYLVAARGKLFHARAHVNVSARRQRAHRVDEKSYLQHALIELVQGLKRATPDALVVQTLRVQAYRAQGRRQRAPPFAAFFADPFAIRRKRSPYSSAIDCA